MQRQSKRTRRRFIKGAGAIGTVALAGCGGNGSSDGESGSDGSGETTGTGTESMADSIVFYNAGSLKYDPGTEANIERFEDETGISVEVNEVPWNNLKTSLTTIWRNKDATVDAFNGPTWWLADFVASDWLEPLELGDSHMSNFPKNLQNLVTLDGKTYMAPEFGKWGTYLYDQTHFEEQGVSEAPQTWDEVVSKGQQLKTENTSPFAFTWSNKSVFTFKQFLYQAGGQLFNDSNEPVFVDGGMDVMDFFTKLRTQDLIPDGISSMGEGGAGDTFIAGQLASVESWTPLGARALDADGWGKDRLASAKPPKGPDSRATFQDTNGISVSAFSEKKRAAKKFAQFMTTTKSSKTNMKVEGNPAVIPSVYDSEEIQSQYPSWLLEDMKFNLEHAKSETYLAQPQVDDYLAEQITPALLGDKDPQKALETAQSNIERLYQDIGLL
ncbi:sugar ABC transporter substrate-binding protein [Haloarcula pellucida]|uniref:Sugar ABC transporter substrate-binding protein n=1 Tax=Haloarcula pellucida TaxID=1427151 RepID=A0A830GGN6_9EURY|nr:substrate-binding domain-containing protein [Halomicroarcula pellucida]MBX0346802.1 substrate-binding domain-containing protein [Halomicroarcula pellucida]GGN85562.1 sugar ABC transporter substrate-binding protein [Halomicroarcula pellucida]